MNMQIRGSEGVARSQSLTKPPIYRQKYVVSFRFSLSDSLTITLRFESHRRSFASNLEQVANLLGAQEEIHQDEK